VAHSIHNCGDDFLLSVSGGTGNKREWRRDMRDRAKAVLSARTASKQADKIIDLRDSAIRNCRSRCVELDRRRDFPLPPRLGDSVSFSCPWGLAR